MNRYLHHWQRSDAAAIIAAIFVCAGIALSGGRLLLARGPRARHVGAAAVVLLLLNAVLGLMINLTAPNPWWVDWIVPIAAYATVAITLLFTSRLVSAARGCLLLLSPLAPILILQVATYRPIDIRPESVQAGAAVEPRSPVLFILFDDWSYTRTIDLSRDVDRELTNLRSLADSALFFSNAISPGAQTTVSIPSLLRQQPSNNDSSQLPPEPLDNSRQSSLVAAAAADGYRVTIAGFYLPYRALVGDAAAYVYAEPNWPKGESGLEKLWMVFRRNFQFMGDPLTRYAGVRMFNSDYNRYWFEMNRRIDSVARATISQMGTNDFFFVHYPLPHSPFVFSASGAFQPDSVTARMEASPAKYSVHLRYLDVVLGRLLTTLRTRGLYDSAMVIVTSDHSWSQEPLRPRQPRHVPLVIKLPDQRAGLRIDTPICLSGIGQLIAALSHGDRPLEAAVPTRVDALARQSCANERALTPG